MPVVHQLSQIEARRVAIHAQLLTAERPTDLVDVVRRLGYLQLDWTKAVAYNADLVLWSRLGSSYTQQDLRDAIDEQVLIDLRGLLRPAEDIALFRAEMAEWPGVGELKDWQEERRGWVQANNAFRLDILDRLRADGPLPTRELPDTCLVPWSSSGWNQNRNLAMMLDFMSQRGEIAVAGGTGRDRLWDLADRVYPDDPIVPSQEASRIRDERRLRALGVARARGVEYPAERTGVGEAGEPATIEGVRGNWRVDPAYLDRPFRGRAALLSPLDRLVADRKRLHDIFDFDYQLEMYKPVEQRRWGYWAMPILYDDRLVGKLDATTDHDAGELRVAAVHEDVPFTKEMTAAVWGEIEDLAAWLGLGVVSGARQHVPRR